MFGNLGLVLLSATRHGKAVDLLTGLFTACADVALRAGDAEVRCQGAGGAAGGGPCLPARRARVCVVRAAAEPAAAAELQHRGRQQPVWWVMTPGRSLLDVMDCISSRPHGQFSGQVCAIITTKLLKCKLVTTDHSKTEEPVLLSKSDFEPCDAVAPLAWCAPRSRVPPVFKRCTLVLRRQAVADGDAAGGGPAVHGEAHPAAAAQHGYATDIPAAARWGAYCAMSQYRPSPHLLDARFLTTTAEGHLAIYTSRLFRVPASPSWAAPAGYDVAIQHVRRRAGLSVGAAEHAAAIPAASADPRP